MTNSKKMLDKINSSEVLLKKLLNVLAYASTREFKLCVVEGSDDEYFYSKQLEKSFPNGNFRFFSARGKENVLEIYNIMESNVNYSHKNDDIGYFIDRDTGFNIASKYKNNSKIYITPCHSIENFFFNEQTFMYILDKKFLIHDYLEKDIYDNFVSLFKQFKEDTLKAFKIYNIAFYMQNEYKYTTQHDTSNTLHSTNIFGRECKDIINIREYEKNNKVVIKDGVKNDLNQLIGDLENTQLVKQDDHLSLTEYDYHGKLLVYMISLFLEYLHNELIRQKGKKFVQNIYFSNKDMIRYLSDCVDMPLSLCTFIQGRFQ